MTQAREAARKLEETRASLRRLDRLQVLRAACSELYEKMQNCVEAQQRMMKDQNDAHDGLRRANAAADEATKELRDLLSERAHVCAELTSARTRVKASEEGAIHAEQQALRLQG